MTLSGARLGSYIAWEAHRGYLIVAAVLLTLIGLISMMEELQKVGDGAYHASDAVFVVLAGLPSRMITLLPFVALLGTLFALGEMARHSELVAIAAAGVSRRGIAFWVAVPAILWSIAAMSFDGELAAPWYRQAMLTRSLRISQNANVLSGSGFWARGDDRFVNIGQLEAGTVPRDIRIYEFDAARHLVSLKRAGFGQVMADGTWRLFEVSERRFGTPTGPDARAPGQVWEPLWGRETPLEPAPLDSLSLLELSRYVGYLERTMQSARQAQTVLWRRAMLPVSMIVMALLAVPFAAGTARSARLGVRLASGVAVGLGFFLGDQLVLNMGLLLGAPAALTAVLPLALVGLVWLVLHRRRI